MQAAGLAPRLTESGSTSLQPAGSLLEEGRPIAVQQHGHSGQSGHGPSGPHGQQHFTLILSLFIAILLLPVIPTVTEKTQPHRNHYTRSNRPFTIPPDSTAWRYPKPPSAHPSRRLRALCVKTSNAHSGDSIQMVTGPPGAPAAQNPRRKFPQFAAARSASGRHRRPENLVPEVTTGSRSEARIRPRRLSGTRTTPAYSGDVTRGRRAKSRGSENESCVFSGDFRSQAQFHSRIGLAQR